MFTNEELTNIAKLLQRVNLTGNEAIPLAQLQIKIGGLIKETAPKEELGEVTGTN